MNPKKFRKKIAFREEKNNEIRDIDFIGSYYPNNENWKRKGFFNLFHGKKEDEKGFIRSLVELAEDEQVIYEFIQNAVDANSSHFYIFWDEDNFLVINNGSKFKDNEIESILNVSQSTKSKDELEKIGKFGIGFKLIHRLVGKDNGLNEIIDEYKGPLLFSWDKSYIKRFLNKDLKDIDKQWFFKILYTNFPCAMEETIKDKDYRERIAFKKTEYNDLINFMNKQDINLDYLEEGTVFFLKLGKGKAQLLNDELRNIKNGIKYSLNIIKNFSKNRDKKLDDININGIKIKSENLDSIITDDYIFLCPINQKDSILFSTKNDNEKISFFKFFPMGDQRNSLNFILHSYKFDIESNRRKLHETPINKELLTNISNSLKDEFNKIKNNDIERYRNILLNLYLSDLETANNDKLIQEYLTSNLYQYIQHNIPTKDNKIIKDKNLVKIIDSKLNISLLKYSEFYFDDETIIREAKRKLGIRKWNIFDILINDNIESWVQKLSKEDSTVFLEELNKAYGTNNTYRDFNLKNKAIFLFGKTFLSINGIPENYFFRGTFDIQTESILEKLGFIFSKNNMAIYKNLLNLNKKSINASLFTNLYTQLEVISILEVFEKHNIKNFAILKINKKYQISSELSHTYIKDAQFKDFITENNYDRILDISLIPDVFKEKIITLTKIAPRDRAIKERLIREKEHKEIIDFIVKEDDILKNLFINSVGLISLEVNKRYLKSDYESKVIKFFIQNNRADELKSKIYIDGESIDEKLTSPVITFKYGEVKLTDINHRKYNNTIVSEDILNIVNNFDEIDASLLEENIFNFRELDKEDFLESWSNPYKKTISRGKLEFLIYLSIERHSKSYFENITKLDFDFNKIFRLLENILIIDKESKVKYPFSISDFFPNLNNEYYIKDKDYALDRETLDYEIMKNLKILEVYKKFGLKINDGLLKIRKKLKNKDEISNDEIKKLSDKELLSNLEFLKQEKEFYSLDMKNIETKNIHLIYQYLSSNTILTIFPILKNKSNFRLMEINNQSKFYITKQNLNSKNTLFNERVKIEIKNKNIIYHDLLEKEDVPNYWTEIEENEEERKEEKKESLNRQEEGMKAEIGDASSDSKESNWFIGWRGEKYVYNLLLDKFSTEQITWHNENSKSIKDDNGETDIELKINGITYFIEVKATVQSIYSGKDVRFFMSSSQFQKFSQYGKNYHLVFVTNIDGTPEHLYFGFNPNWLNEL
jgi:hypothetical protein